MERWSDMRRIAVFQIVLWSIFQSALAINPPINPVTRTGDRSIVLHWDPNTEANLSGYRVYRSLTNTGPFTLQTATLLTTPGFSDLAVNNGQKYFYQVTAVSSSQESSPSVTTNATPNPFPNDDAFLD